MSWVHHFPVQDDAGNVVNDVEVMIRRELDQSPVQPYADEDLGDALGNPFPWEDGSLVTFYVEDADAYRIIITKSGFQRDLRHVQIGSQLKSKYWSEDILGNLTGIASTTAGQPRGNRITIPAQTDSVGANKIFQDLGAAVHRLNDRVLIGAATVNDGLQSQSTKDWLETLVPITTQLGQLVSISTIGHMGVIGASRASDAVTGVANGMGVTGIVDNNKTSSTPHIMWAFYGEARHRTNDLAGAYTFCVETDIISDLGSDAGGIHPYDMLTGLRSANLWMSNARPDVESGDATVFLGIKNNAGLESDTSGRYAQGIVFEHNVLIGSDGLTGSASAILLAKGHQLEWYNQHEDVPRALITSQVSVNAATLVQQHISFTDDGILFGNSGSGRHSLFIPPIVNAVNTFAIAGATAGNPPIMSVNGTDTNVSMSLFGKGTGNLMWNNIVVVDSGANLALASGKVVKINGVQILASQGAAVANATDAATTQARLNDLLARCRAHGIIAT